MTAAAPARADAAAPDEEVARSVIARIARDNDVSRETAERWFFEALKFLGLSRSAASLDRPFCLVPSAPVDAAWHAFLLHTRPYREYCERAFGEFIDHDPAPIDVPFDWSMLLHYLRTRVLMEDRYGAIEEDLWPLP